MRSRCAITIDRSASTSLGRSVIRASTLLPLPNDTQGLGEVWAELCRFPVDPFEDHRQLRARDFDPRFGHTEVEGEGALLESLVEEPEPVSIPHQQLDAIARAVEESEDVPGERISFEVLAHHRAKAVVRFPEVDRVASEEDTG